MPKEKKTEKTEELKAMRRWRLSQKRKPFSHGLAGPKNPRWKDGKYKHPQGYIYILKPNHPYAIKRGYVLKARLIVESYIGRYLKPQERCHHINEIKDDNHPGNLMAFLNSSAHQRYHHNLANVKPEEIIFDGRKLKQPASI